ncbi:MAG: hypothetical protein KJ571_06040 [Bacteroidetes bacterium]|nr:hypothetical protein [Bacteroidota bacterium]
MKTKPVLLLFIILQIILFNGCSNQELTKDSKIEFLSKSKVNDHTTIYKYKFQFNGKAWMEIPAYVKKENNKYEISVNQPPANNLNKNIYTPEIDEGNLIISNRIRHETVNSLEEAIEKSILFYLSDNI